MVTDPRKRYITSVVALMVLVAAFACGKAGGGADEDEVEVEAAAACDAIELAPPDAGRQVELPVHIPAGAELQYCKLIMLEEDLNLRYADGYYTQGSHHGRIYRTGYHGSLPAVTVDGSPGDASKPHPCQRDMSQTWTTIGGGRPVGRQGTVDDFSPVAKGVFPDNVAVRLSKGDVIALNFHMLNNGDEAIDACFKANLHGVPDSEVEFEAGAFTLYNLHITVPPGGSGSARMACPVLSEGKMVSASNHMHQRGVRARAWLWDGKPTDPAARQLIELYDQSEWEEPAISRFEEPIAMTPGQWIEWTCDYENPSERSISQGRSTMDEMCVFIGAYYPRDINTEHCADPVSGAKQLNGINIADGELDGKAFLECLFSSPPTVVGEGDDPMRYASQRCFTNACKALSPLTQPFLLCLATNGIEGCAEQQAEIAATECGE